MRQTKKITLLKKKVANKKKRNTYKRIKIKKIFRNKKRGGNLKCRLSNTLGRKSVKVLSKELNEIGDINDNTYAVDKKEYAIEVLKKLKDHYKNNSRTMPCDCSLKKKDDPNNDEKFSNKNECENAKVEYYRNLLTAFTNVRNFVISKYKFPEEVGMKDEKSLEEEKDNLQTIIDEIEKKIADHDEKIEERIHKVEEKILVDTIPPPTGSKTALEEFHEKLMARTEKNRRDYQKKDNIYRLKKHLNAVEKDRALDRRNSKKPDTKYSIHEKELASLSDVQGDMKKIKEIDETKRKTKRKTRRR